MCCEKVGVGLGLPCKYLKGGLCSIYENRPGECAAFPVRSDFSDHGIGCPGLKRFIVIKRIVGRGIPYYLSPIDLENGLRYRYYGTPERIWNKIWLRLSKSLTPEEKEFYLNLNKIV